ncbi:MAG: hypothetical protein LBP70_02365 [Mycoplasmataceae bacterium]|nr:hypothetical protein [Mycoplasmataceae bacterium]
MTKDNKKQTVGGIAPMLLWVIIMGVSMAVSTATHTASSIIDAKQRAKASNEHQNKKSYYAFRQNNGYIRMSAYPSRSTMMAPL